MFLTAVAKSQNAMITAMRITKERIKTIIINAMSNAKEEEGEAKEEVEVGMGGIGKSNTLDGGCCCDDDDDDWGNHQVWTKVQVRFKDEVAVSIHDDDDNGGDGGGGVVIPFSVTTTK